MPASLGLPRNAHVFVDETKAREFILVATWVAPANLVRVRKAMRSLVPSGRVRIHFKKLTDAQRDRVLGVLSDLPLCCTVVRLRGLPAPEARAAALQAVLGSAATHGAALVVLETDEPSRAADLTVARGVFASVRHLRHFEEPILWASDAVAWCLQRRGPWPAKVEPLIRSDQFLDKNKPGMRP